MCTGRVALVSRHAVPSVNISLKRVGAALAMALLLFLVGRIRERQPGDLSPQSRINAHFAERGSLAAALRLYPKYWPPLYPTLLWLSARAGLSPGQANQAFFSLALFLLCLYAWRFIPDIHWLYPVALLAVAHFNYVNMHQHVSEMLFVFLSLALLLLLLRYRRTGSRADLMLLGACGSLLCLTKYFALFFAVPVAVFHIVTQAPGDRRRRLVHGALFLIMSVPPVGVWMGLAYSESGYLTGSDRFAPRQFQELTTFEKNVAFTAKTLFVDFFSLEKYASHGVVNEPYEASPHEWILAGLAIAAALMAARASWSAPRPPAEGLAPPGRSPAVLVAEFFVLYTVMTIALWTVGNNDPIYTRFLYPSYPFLVLLGFHAYSTVKRSSASFWARLPFRALYALLVMTHSVRDFHAVALPLR